MTAPKRRLALLRWSLLVALLAPSLFTPARVWSHRSSEGRISERVEDVPARSAAVVFGAGLFADGRPSYMLADRVDAAVALYRAGRVQHLLLSGDNSSADYDEPTSMRRRALDGGVPAEAITLDFAGFSTHDTCVRARSVFGVRDAVLVTQQFHIARAVATCRAKGIDAHGLALSTDVYPERAVAVLVARDRVATLKAYWDDLRDAPPRFDGPFVGLSGSATLPPVNQAWDERLSARPAVR